MARLRPYSINQPLRSERTGDGHFVVLYCIAGPAHTLVPPARLQDRTDPESIGFGRRAAEASIASSMDTQELLNAKVYVRAL